MFQLNSGMTEEPFQRNNSDMSHGNTMHLRCNKKTLLLEAVSPMQSAQGDIRKDSEVVKSKHSWLVEKESHKAS
jgi:hypothetical protein